MHASLEASEAVPDRPGSRAVTSCVRGASSAAAIGCIGVEVVVVLILVLLWTLCKWRISFGVRNA